MAGDVAVFAVSGQSPMYNNGTATVAVNLQGTPQEYTARRYQTSVNDVTLSGYLSNRFDDVNYYN